MALIATLLALSGLPALAANPKIAQDVFLHQRIKQRVESTLGLNSIAGAAQLASAGLASSDPQFAQVAIYYARRPDEAELKRLEGLNIKLATGGWVPPVASKHPTGFLLAQIPYQQLETVAAGTGVIRIRSTERALRPLNDQAATRIGADLVHQLTPTSYNGAGVNIAILDSSLDLTHVDIPAPVEAYDVTDGVGIANWGTDVSATMTDHGTHVTGSALGRGTASGGQYKGVAPGASLYFYKIGNDTNASASEEDMVEATARAAELGVDIVSISYGGWTYFMDGSEPMCQAIDAAVAAGVTVFISAGNSRTDNQHDRVQVSPGASTFANINFTINNALNPAGYTSDVYLNAVHRDGTTGDNNVSFTISNLGPGESFTQDAYSWSSRDSESTVFRLAPNLGPGEIKTYQLTIHNSATYPVDAHLYLFADFAVRFDDYDAASTIEAPALADDAIAVGAWVSREYWVNWLGDTYTSYFPENTLAPFSSAGPRPDGLLKPTLCAPGASVISCRDHDMPLPVDGLQIDSDGSNDGTGPVDYVVKNGTSMACPIAAGAAALLLEAFPGLSPTQVRLVLTDTASNHASPNNLVGAGLINAFAAVTRDCNTNGTPDVVELSNQTVSDCNANLVPDECDTASGASDDCNVNGTPDECEIDCNDNCTIDAEDIAGGTSEDFNYNGVPDECESSDIPGYLGRVIARDGDPAPGTGGIFYSVDGTPRINNRKEVAFLADTSAGEGLFFSSNGVMSTRVLEGTAIPGTTGVLAEFYDFLCIDDSGNVAFRGLISGPQQGQGGLFLSTPAGVSTIINSGGPVPPNGEPFSFGTLGVPACSRLGEVFFAGVISGPSPIGDNGAVLRYSGGNISLIAASGMACPGIGTLSTIESGPWASPDGVVAFHATIDGLDMLIRYRDGVFGEIANRNDLAPGTGGPFTFFDDYASLSGRTEMYFEARTWSGVRGIFKSGLTGELAALALGGNPAPVTGATYGTPAFPSGNPLGQVYFFSTLTGGDSPAGIFRLDQRLGQTRPLMLQGDPAPAAPGLFVDDAGRFGTNALGDWSVAYRATDGARRLVLFDQALVGDLDGDDDVDITDYNTFVLCFEGPGQSGDSPLCARADLDTDGDIDVYDFALMQDAYVECEQGGMDCNGNGVGDPCEVEGSIATDCDGNGTIDECDIALAGALDCNANWRPDYCDIASGLTPDLDSNGLPDACEAFADCNFNGIGDVFDVADGTSLDCDGDDVPDECELLAGPLRLIAFFRQPDNRVVEMNPTDGAAVSSLSSGNIVLADLAETCDGHIWGLGAGGEVVSVDPNSGAVSVVSGPGGYLWGGAAFDCADGVLYGATWDGPTIDNGLYRVSTLDGSVEFVGNVTRPMPSLAFDSAAQRLYGISSGILWSIDESTAHATLLCQITPFSEAAGLCFDEGLLYALVNTHLYRIDPASCSVTLIGTPGLPYYDGTGLACIHASTDCNANATPDNCDITAGIAEDCNSSGIPDPCEFADGLLHDCNSNGTMDECESELGSDCNTDGLIDLCQLQAPRLLWNHLFGGIYVAQLDGSGTTNIGGANTAQPTGLAFDPIRAKVYWADRTLDRIQRANLDGSGVQTVFSLPNSQIHGLAIDPAGGYLFWVDITADRVQRGDLNGANLLTLATDLVNPLGIALDISNRRAYWTDGGTNGRVWRVNYDGNDASIVVSSPGVSFLGIALDAEAGQVYWSEPAAGRIRRANLDGSQAIDLLSGLATPRGIALDFPTSSIYWVADGVDRVQRAPLGGGPVSDVTPTVGSTPWYLEVLRQTLGDCNVDAVLDACDITTGTSFDCDNNGIPDECGTSSTMMRDCNKNGVPDACDVNIASQDCNLNRVPDECDIAAGTSTDINSSGRPDECEDCNQNGVTDDVDIASGTSLDCQPNGTPDECESDCNTNGTADGCDVESGASDDCNSNAIPDECERRQTLLFWSNWGSIERANVDGTDRRIIASGFVRGLAIDAVQQKVYWLDVGTPAGSIWRADLDGAAPQLLVSGLELDCDGLALDQVNSRLVWCRRSETQGRLQRVNLDGSQLGVLVDTLFAPISVAIDNTNARLYWINQQGIRRVLLDGTGQESIVTWSDDPTRYEVVADSINNHLWWSFTNRVSPVRQGVIYRSDLGGVGSQAVLPDLPSPYQVPIAIDSIAGKVYWYEDGAQTIRRANLDGSGIENVITTGLSGVPRLALLLSAFPPECQP